jgi:murein L,D-transpeptidase YafK
MTTSVSEAKVNHIRTTRLPQLTAALQAQYLQPGTPMYARVFKEEAVLELWVRANRTGLYQLFKTYPICAFSGQLGPKLKEGDLQAPEGFYEITQERLVPGSQYHLAMNIGFPNEYDMNQGRTGSKLMIHGDCKSEGCFAMTNAAIEEIYVLVEQSLKGGQQSVPVHVFPFRMTDENIQRYVTSQWLDFWLNIKHGYDLFEETRIPPAVQVLNTRYVFAPQVFIYRDEAV